MKKYIFAGIIVIFFIGLYTGAILGFFKKQTVLLDTNQKIDRVPYTLVYGYWNKQGVLETFK